MRPGLQVHSRGVNVLWKGNFPVGGRWVRNAVLSCDQTFEVFSFEGSPECHSGIHAEERHQSPAGRVSVRVETRPTIIPIPVIPIDPETMFG